MDRDTMGNKERPQPAFSDRARDAQAARRARAAEALRANLLKRKARQRLLRDQPPVAAPEPLS